MRVASLKRTHLAQAFARKISSILPRRNHRAPVGGLFRLVLIELPCFGNCRYFITSLLSYHDTSIINNTIIRYIKSRVHAGHAAAQPSSSSSTTIEADSERACTDSGGACFAIHHRSTSTNGTEVPSSCPPSLCCLGRDCRIGAWNVGEQSERASSAKGGYSGTERCPEQREGWYKKGTRQPEWQQDGAPDGCWPETGIAWCCVEKQEETSAVVYFSAVPLFDYTRLWPENHRVHSRFLGRGPTIEAK